MTQRASHIQTGPLDDHHHAAWDRLFVVSCDFYKVAHSKATRDEVWQKVRDPHCEIEGLAAIDASGAVIGIAHFQNFIRPLMPGMAGYLHDLYVDPDNRQGGVGRALIEAVAEIGKVRGWTMIRWMTHPTNQRARALYDQIATASEFMPYDMKLSS